jgi:type IV pilus assembly protein PilE
VKTRAQKGFTLIELMIVVLIIGILAAIAIPSYSAYVKRGARTKATQALLDVASREERYFYEHNTYTTTLSDLGLPSTYCVDTCTDSRRYVITIQSADPTNYVVRATPQATQAAQDGECGYLEINRAGQKTSQHPGQRCWGS